MNHSRYWTNSIDWPEDFSGGPLLKSFIRPWNPKEYDPSAGESCIHSFFYGIEPGTTYEVTITIGGSGENALGRVLGCLMIGTMPDEGLEEALYSLRDILEFHSRKPAPLPARLTAKAIDATVADKKKRPDLVIA